MPGLHCVQGALPLAENEPAGQEPEVAATSTEVETRTRHTRVS